MQASPLSRTDRAAPRQPSPARRPRGLPRCGRAWVFLLERLDVLDQVVGITAQEAAGLDRILDARQLGGRRTLGIAHDLYLLLGDRAHETQLAEHLHVFLVILCRFLHALLAAVGHVEVVTEAQSLAELD